MGAVRTLRPTPIRQDPFHILSPNCIELREWVGVLLCCLSWHYSQVSPCLTSKEDLFLGRKKERNRREKKERESTPIEQFFLASWRLFGMNLVLEARWWRHGQRARERESEREHSHRAVIPFHLHPLVPGIQDKKNMKQKPGRQCPNTNPTPPPTLLPSSSHSPSSQN